MDSIHITLGFILKGFIAREIYFYVIMYFLIIMCYYVFCMYYYVFSCYCVIMHIQGNFKILFTFLKRLILPEIVESH